jgi:cation diffusion facilitator family transporter
MTAQEAIIKEYVSDSVKHTRNAMWLSLSVGITILLLKIYAYTITGSAAILSDAAESVVHNFAVAFAAYSLWFSQKPADKSHMYGHDRISFFSAGFEGAMIILAAVVIMYEAIQKWINGLYLENIGIGTLFIALSTIVNGGLGWYLVRQGKKYHSIVLEANGKHVLTDSWTSLGVIVALVLTMRTGWLPFDPILAILVALNILWTGSKLIRRSIGGLMDEADPVIDEKIRSLLQRETEKNGIKFHNLRHRNAGNRILIEFHLLFPDHIPIAEAHEQATNIEKEIYNAFPMQLEIISHLEPIECHDEVHQKIFNKNQTAV